MLNVKSIRNDFPILERKVNGYPLVYLDNAATSQTPISVIKTISEYYSLYNANIHRGVHALSQEATEAYELARKKIQIHLHAAHTHEIIFTSGTTESINLVAWSYGESLKKDDEIIVSALEHHSNIVPWQMLCERKGIELKVIPISSEGILLIEEYKKLLSEKTKLVAVNHISNALGTINPIKEIITAAHEVGALVLIDGAQAVPHLRPDVQELDADFYAFSGHKALGPTGIGVLYGKEEHLQRLPPYQGGGEMISEVTWQKTSYADLPHKYEAGTPNICGGIALGSALDYLNTISLEEIALYEESLLAYATQKLLDIEGLRIIGPTENKAAVISFNVRDIHPYDIGSLLDQMGIAVRTGHHCTQPIMDYYKIPGTIRASFSFYNTLEEVDKLTEGVRKSLKMLR